MSSTATRFRFRPCSGEVAQVPWFSAHSLDSDAGHVISPALLSARRCMQMNYVFVLHGFQRLVREGLSLSRCPPVTLRAIV